MDKPASKPESGKLIANYDRDARQGDAFFPVYCEPISEKELEAERENPKAWVPDIEKLMSQMEMDCQTWLTIHDPANRIESANRIADSAAARPASRPASRTARQVADDQRLKDDLMLSVLEAKRAGSLSDLYAAILHVKKTFSRRWGIQKT